LINVLKGVFYFTPGFEQKRDVLSKRMHWKYSSPNLQAHHPTNIEAVINIQEKINGCVLFQRIVGRNYMYAIERDNRRIDKFLKCFIL